MTTTAIASGQTSSGTFVEPADTLVVSNGGTAVATVVETHGVAVVSSGDATSGGVMYGELELFEVDETVVRIIGHKPVLADGKVRRFVRG